MRQPITLTLVAFCSIAAAQNPCTSTASLATPYDQNNGLDGIMFDITALQTITINCFEVNMGAGTSDAVIRHKDGTHVGFEANAAAWTAIDSVDGVATAGPNLPTYIPIAVDVTIPSGSTHAFYISNRVASAPNVQYTDGTTLGAVFASDAALQVQQGTGINYPFAFHLSPRKFNGTVYYSIGTTGVEEASTALATLAPNPVADVLQLRNIKGVNIAVTDAMGRMALRTAWNSQLDVSALAPGSYVLTVLDRNGAPTFTRHFLKE